jgi:thiamine pyrophosphokinase
MDVSHIIVVVNGEFARPEPLLAVLQTADLVVAADGGANWLRAQGLAPDVLIGDLDSVAADALAELEAADGIIIRHSTHKDETDTELALLYAIAHRPTHVTVLGALGGRIDHELANIMLLALPQLEGTSTTIYDGASWVRLATAGSVSLSGAEGDLVSLLPWGGDCFGVTTHGLAYPLLDEPLPFGPARGISNVMLAASAEVTVRSGRLLVVHTPRPAAGAAT